MAGAHRQVVSGLTPGAEEGLQEVAAVVGEDAGEDGGAVVELGVVEDAEDGHAAAQGVRQAVDDAGNAGLDDGPGAHGARLFGDIERSVEEPPVAQRGGGLGDGDHFGVGGGVVQQLALVVCAADNGGQAERQTGVGVGADDDAAGGDFAGRGGAFGLAEGESHVRFVDGGVHGGNVGERGWGMKAESWGLRAAG